MSDTFTSRARFIADELNEHGAVSVSDKIMMGNKSTIIRVIRNLASDTIRTTRVKGGYVIVLDSWLGAKAKDLG